MKKILSLMLALMLVLVPCLLASCSDDDGDGVEVTLDNVATLAEEYYNSLSLSDATKEGKAEFAEYYRLQLQLLDEATTDDEAAAKYAEVKANLDAKYKEMFVDVGDYRVSAQRAAFKAEIDTFAASKNINADVFGETQRGIFYGKVEAEKTKIDAIDSTIDMRAQLTASKNTINIAVQYAIDNAGISSDSPIYAALQAAKDRWLAYANGNVADKSLSGMLSEDRTDMESIYTATTVAICGESTPEMLDIENPEGHVKLLEAALAEFYEGNKDSISIAKAKALENLEKFVNGELEGPGGEKLDKSLLTNSGKVQLQEKYELERDYIIGKTGTDIDSKSKLEQLQWTAALSIYGKYLDILASPDAPEWTPVS